MGTMATGMAFGAGSEIAHQGVRAMMGGGSGHGGGGEHGGQAPAEGGSYGGQGYADEGQMQQQQMEQAQPQQHPCFDFSQGLFQCLQTNKDQINFCQNQMDALSMCEKSQQYNQNYMN